MVSFADLKKNRIEMSKKVLAKVKQEENQYHDERFWQLTPDKDGFGRAVIRFLPAGPEDDAPFVKLFKHQFKGTTGQWYIENCLTTIGKSDPVVDANNKAYATKDENVIASVKGRGRKANFISNILVVKDPSNPDNEGKVFLFRYGKKLYEKVMSPFNPRFDDDPQFDPFDMWEGANFKLTLTRTGEGKEARASWDDSKYENQSPLFKGDDAKIEEVWNKCYVLNEFIDPETAFKSYEDLQRRLNFVDGIETEAKDAEDEKVEEEQAENIEQENERNETPSTKEPSKRGRPTKQTSSDDDDEDDDVDFGTLG